MRKIEFWASTHQGLQRTNNEDAYLWLTPEDTGGNGYLWVVCDGMGGEAAGEQAAAVVLERIQEVYPATLAQSGSPHHALTETLTAANRRLLYLSKEQPELAGMGSTVAAVAMYRDRLWVATVGDSRVYGWTPNGLMQWTVDHTKYEKLKEHGVLSAEEERPDHPARNVLMNVIGREAMTVDTLDGRHFATDECALLICSDGLSNNVNPKELRVAFASLDARDAARFLLSAALQRSSDNITLQVIRFVPPVAPRSIEDVAASFGVTLIDAHQDPEFKESGQMNGDASQSTSVTAENSSEDPPKKPITQEIVLPTHQGKTVLISPDALSNVFGDDTPSDEDTEEIFQRRLSSHKGTVLISPDALSKAKDSQKQNAPKPVRPTTPVRAHPPVHSEAIETLDPPRRTDLDAAVAADRKEKPAPRRHLTLPPEGSEAAFEQGIDDAPPEERRVFLWLLLILLVAGVAIALWWWWQLSDDAQDGASEAIFEEAQMHEDPAMDGASAALGFVPAKTPTPPDHVHARDQMPAYRVANAQWWIDAHEVTEQQFDHVREDVVARGGDNDHLSRFACLGASKADGNTARPACVSPQAAALYCAAVGRTLPTPDQWQEIVATDSDQIARGYDRLFETAEDGAPPVYPSTAQAIVGVFDGLPEVLAQNDTQRRYGDLVLLAPRGEQLVRTDASGADDFVSEGAHKDRMVGVRCIVPIGEEDESPDLPEPLQDRQRSTDRNVAPKAGSSASAREERRISPRMDAPDEAPIDENIPDRSRILDYMKEQQQR